MVSLSRKGDCSAPMGVPTSCQDSFQFRLLYTLPLEVPNQISPDGLTSMPSTSPTTSSPGRYSVSLAKTPGTRAGATSIIHRHRRSHGETEEHRTTATVWISATGSGGDTDGAVRPMGAGMITLGSIGRWEASPGRMLTSLAAGGHLRVLGRSGFSRSARRFCASV